MKKKIISTIVAVALAVVCLVSFSGNSYAEGFNKKTYVDKAYLQALRTCVTGRIRGDRLWEESIYLNYRISFDDWNSTYSLYQSQPGTDEKIHMFPTNHDGSFGYGTSDEMNCKSVIRDSKKNIFNWLGVTVPSATEPTAVNDFLVNKLGYTRESESAEASATGSAKCFHLKIHRKFYEYTTAKGNTFLSQDTADEEPVTDSICFTMNADDSQVQDVVIKEPDSGFMSINRAAEVYMLADDGYVKFYNGYEAYNYAVYGETKGAAEVKVTGKSYESAIADIKKQIEDGIPSARPFYASEANTMFSCGQYTSGYDTICTVNRTNGSDFGGDVINMYTYWSGDNGVVNESSESSAAKTAVWTLDTNYSVNGIRAVAKMTGYSGYDFDDAMAAHVRDNVYFTKDEKLQLYLWYFEMSGATTTCASDLTEEQKSRYEGPFYFYEQGKTVASYPCYAETTPTTSSYKYNGLVKLNDDSAYFKFSSDAKISFTDLLDFFKNLPEDYRTMNTAANTSSTISVNPNDTNGWNNAQNEDSDRAAEEAKKNCYDSAGSSNWIACPIIDHGTSASQVMYGFIENMLQVNTNLFSTDGKVNGSFETWSTFRNIANFVFIIVFIIVILSQVTGLGIDNYGVKKILPKLILGALLVNVSFFVCQASVDVANITGGGIKNILNSTLNNMAYDKDLQVAFSQAQAAEHLTEFSAVAILVAIVAAAWYFSGGSILVPLLLGVIAIVIGIIFLLVLLAVRQGLAVILVAISPLAFIAYMLPNTKSLFSKWLKLFSGVLLAYPICSMVIYGGEMVSAIMLLAGSDGKVTNFALALTAAILSIAPVFFIPMLITKSMSGIATVANGVKARATSLGKGAFDRSHTAENMRNVAAARKDQMNANRAQRTIDSLRGRKDLNTAQRARLRTAQNVKDSYLRKNTDLYSGMTKTMDKEALMQMGAEAFGEDGSYDAEKFDAAIAQLYATGNDEDAFKLIQQVSGNTSNMNTEQLEKFKTTLATRGGTIGKAYAKVLGSSDHPMSLSDAMANGKMADAFHGMGSNAVAGMTKDELKYLSGFNLSNMFTDEQLASAAATHTSGKAGTNFNSLLGATGQASAVKSKLSAEQWAKASEATLAALGFSADDNDKMAQSIIDSGDGELISTISGKDQRDAFDRINQQKAADAAAEAAQKEAMAKAQAAKIKRDMQAQDSQQRFQQRMVQAMEQIKNNMNQPPKNPPETFSDGGGI